VYFFIVSQDERTSHFGAKTPFEAKNSMKSWVGGRAPVQVELENHHLGVIMGEARIRIFSSPTISLFFSFSSSSFSYDYSTAEDDGDECGQALFFVTTVPCWFSYYHNQFSFSSSS
jgi:hypothetical protein